MRNIIKNVSKITLTNIPLINFVGLLLLTMCAMKGFISENLFTICNFIIGTGLLSNIHYIKYSNTYHLTWKTLPYRLKDVLKSINIVSSLGILCILITNLVDKLGFFAEYYDYLHSLIVIESIFFGLLVLIGFCIKSREIDKDER